MINTLVSKVKGFILNPVETFRQSENDEPGTVFSYFGILLLLNAILSALITAIGIRSIPAAAGMPWGAGDTVMIFFLMLVGGFIATIIFAAWLHLWVYILGGRKGIMQTISAIVYGSTPCLLLGWIPFIGFIFTLWSLVLSILGIRELQELSTVKAILAVAIAVMIPLIIIILLAAWFMISVVTVTAVSPANAFPTSVN